MSCRTRLGLAAGELQMIANMSCHDKYRRWFGGPEALKEQHASTEL